MASVYLSKTGQPITAAALDRLADYWASVFERVGKRDAFRAALRERLMAHEGSVRRVRLHVDYDPFDELLEAVHDVGIDCSGNLFSADGLFPYKHRSWVDGDVVTVVEGYGAPERVLEGGS